MNKEDFKDKSIDWLEGYLSACYNFAVWHNGTMVLGCGMVTYRQVEKLLREVIAEKKKEAESHEA